MPSSFSSRSSRTAVSIAACAAEPLARSIGTWPTPVKNSFLSQPTGPGWVKYSRLARKVMRRGTSSGRKKESATARWLLARIAPPCAGTCSTPSMLGRKTSRSSGPRSTNLDHQYSTRVCPLQIDGRQPTERRVAPTTTGEPGRLGHLQFGPLPWKDGSTVAPLPDATAIAGAGRARDLGRVSVNSGSDERPPPSGGRTPDEFDAIVAGWAREGSVPQWPAEDDPVLAELDTDATATVDPDPTAELDLT